MSGRTRLLLAAGLLGVAACGAQTQPGTGRLNGTNSVAVVRVGGQGTLADGGTVLVDALYGQLAFVTSSRANELKAINLYASDSQQIRDYIPAPNPLQPLSIPVVTDPIEIVAPVRYDTIKTTLVEFPSGVLEGQVRTGALIFARGAASFGISVVSAANVPEGLREMTNGLLLQSAGPVTAISARLTSTEDNVVLYYATFDGQDATLWERVLQHPVTASSSFRGQFPTKLVPVNQLSPPTDCSPSSPPPQVDANPATLYLCPPRAVRTYQNASISALQVLPTQGSDPRLPVFNTGLEGGRLGVALRLLVPPLNNPALSNAGEVRIIDPALPADMDASGTSTDPLFRLARFFPPFNVEPPVIPGTPAQPPVRQLLTHARAYDSQYDPDAGANVLPDGGIPVLLYEGARLFGVLDESSCYGSTLCSGILAVDASPLKSDGGTNENYGLLAYDDSDCLRGDDPASQSCILQEGSTNRMLSLQLGIGLVQGVAIQSETTFPTLGGLGLVPLLGVATVSGTGDQSAQIFFFDAVGLRWINTSKAPGIAPSVTPQNTPGPPLVTLNIGSTSVIVDGGNGGATPFVTVTVGVGLYPSAEVIHIVNQGTIPTLALVDGLPYDAGILADGTVAPVLAWPVPDAGVNAALTVVQLNDLLFPINLSGTFCGVTDPDGGAVITVYTFVTGVDDGGTNILTEPVDLRLCPGVAGYSVRAGHGSAEPYLVTGSGSGLLGRMATAPFDGGPAPIFQVPNTITAGRGLTYPRFFNPDVDAGVQIVGDTFFTPGVDGGVSELPLTLQLPNIDDVFFSNPDAFYSFVLSSGFLRASMPISSQDLGFSGLYLPGGVASTRVIDAHGEYVLVLIAYPSANVVIDFIPDLILLGPTGNAAAINVHY